MNISGYLKVKYHVDGMIDRNRDGLSNSLVDCVSSSENDFVRKLAGDSGATDIARLVTTVYAIKVFLVK